MRGASNRWLRRLVLSCIYTMGVLGIVASGGGSDSGSSGGDSDPTPTLPPIAPSGLSATATSSNTIRLSWTNNSNEQDSVVVERSTTSGMRSTTSGSGFATIATLSANTTSYSDNTGLSASTIYYYRVYAANSGGDSGFSNEASATTQPVPVTPPATPTVLSATATSSSSIDLGWTDNSTNETNFVVQRSTTSGSGFTTIATLGANTTIYTDTTGLSASTTYYYRVYATNGAGDSGFSNEAFATTEALPGQTIPTAPTGLGATATSSSSIDLSWTDNSSNESNFVVQRSTTSGSGFTTIDTLSANTTSYSNGGLSASTTYYYRVYATNSGGDSGFSNEASATPDSPPGPAVIDSFVVTQNGVVTNETNFSVGDTVTITVNASDPNNLPLEYVFRRYRNNGFDVTLQDWSATNSLTYTFMEEDAVNGFSIFFGVKNNDGVDADGFFGDAQGSASFNITGLPSPAVPTAPTGLGATASSSSSISLTWSDNSTNETNFVVQRSTITGSGFTTIATLGVNTTSYIDNTGLTASTTYFYQVFATNAAGNSGFSNEANATTLGTSAPLVNAADDPLYVDQWHLKNTGQLGATGVPGLVGQDMNVEPAWTTRSGAGIRIAVVDDGLEIAHEDLTGNIAAGLSHNYLTGGTDPTGGEHGTAVAGIAASSDNTLGGIGAAPRANMVGYNFLQASTATNAADAMTRGSPNVHINTNSWGPPDGTGFLFASGSLWRTAISSGLSNGRNGLGTIYTWAGGNGAPEDNSNYDGLANNRGIIAVAAVNDQGVKSSYSEPGANLWISTPGGGFPCDTHTITTTDRTGGIDGYNTTVTAGVTDYANTNYTKCFNGTSSAAPGAAGVIALVLEARPTLGWRDVRLILAQSARKNDPTDAGWTLSTTTPAYNFNHKYGFGVIDAAAAVTLASTWTNVGAEVTSPTLTSSPFSAIPDNNPTGVSNTINVGASGIANIEFIEITFSAADHTWFGDLDITLTSPAGTVSQLAEAHNCSGGCSGASNSYNGWVFGSARHLGEAADGNWTLTVKDLEGFDIGTFQSWRLKFYGR